ncbi:hypothetical protein SteCoe_31790 [Stentor coeruleus]|uniref:Ion transport domain-containing protein n=1 Tax=Stentor coeruleus TaxID=5963 RepID=A0A1R2B0J4_9CILI|nr:hypothetical protein SteCoe_31790 [Stentor coeruleus]
MFGDNILGIKLPINTSKNIDSRYFEGEDMKFTFNKLEDYIQNFKMTRINTPCQGSAFAITKDERYIVFGSREGRCGVYDYEIQKFIFDIDLKIGSLWTMEFIENDKFILVNGASGAAHKYLFSDFSLVDQFNGHTNQINFIKISSDEKTMYSCSDDRTVRKWNLESSSYEAEILYTHTDTVYAIDLSSDDKFLASGSGDNSVIVYSLELKKVIATLTDPNDLVWCVKFSKKMNFLVAGDEDGLIHVWKFETWEKITTLAGHTARVRFIDISLDGSILVSAGLDCTIKIWDPQGLKKEITLEGHSGWVKCVKISLDQSKIFSISDDRTIAIWKIINDISEIIPNQNIAIELNSSESSNFSLICDINTQTYDLKVKQELLKNDLKNLEVISYSFNIFKNKLYITANNSESNPCFVIYDLANGVKENEKLIKVKKNLYEKNNSETIIKHEELQPADNMDDQLININCIYYSFLFPDERYYVAATYKYLHIFSLPNLSLFATINNILAYKHAAVTNDGLKLFLTGYENILKAFDMSKLLEIQSINLEDSASLMCITPDNQYLIIAFKDSLNILSIKQLQIIKTIPDSGASNIVFSKNQTSFIYSLTDTLCFFDLKNFELITKIELNEKIESFSLCNNNSSIIYITGTNVKILSNPLEINTDEIVIYGNLTNFYSFIDYAYSIILNENPLEYTPEFDSWIIMPYHINLMHFYTYYNKIELLKQALNNKSPFLNSLLGYSPLQICLENGSMKTLDIIYESCYKRLNDGDSWAFHCFGDSLISLNKSGFSKLHNFYEIAFIKSTAPSLPKYCDDSLILPIYIQSNNPVTDINDFDPNYFISDGKSIEFVRSAFKLSISAGSIKSLKFLESILECTNLEIFTTDFLRTILKCKLSAVKGFMVFQTIIYTIYLICLTYTAFFNKFVENNQISVSENSNDAISSWVLLIGFIINVLFFLNELAKMNEGLNYWTNIWNIIDLCRFVLFTVFTWAFYFYAFEISPVLSYLEVLLFLVSWIRGLTFFRTFEKTRYLTVLIFEVFSDMASFMLLTVYSMIGLSLLLLFSEKETYENVFNTIGFTYMTTLGEYQSYGKEVSSFNTLSLIIFTLASIINTILMMNLLISIIGGTFDRIQQELVIRDMKLKAEIIFEIENLMFWKRNMNNPVFIQVILPKGGDNEEGFAWDRKIREIQRSIKTGYDDELSKQIKIKNNNIKEILDSMKKSNEDVIKEMFDSMKKSNEDSINEKIKANNEIIKEMFDSMKKSNDENIEKILAALKN